MKVSPIKYYSTSKTKPVFKADLRVVDSVKDVVGKDNKVFTAAINHFRDWLKYSQEHVSETLTIKKISTIEPKTPFYHVIEKISYAYPHEELGHFYREILPCVENLEFDLKGNKCGFWFNPQSNQYDLFRDFTKMFHHLNKN